MEKIIELFSDERLVYVLVGIIGTKLFDYYLKGREKKEKIKNLKLALINELEDIKDRLGSVILSHENALRVYAIGGVFPEIPLGLSNPIFKEYYKDIVLELGASQRKSYSLINSYVDGINAELSELRKSKPTIENISSESLEEWGDLLKAAYSNASSVYWHVCYHLENSDFPFLDYGNSAEYAAYVEYSKSITKKIDSIISNAKENLKPEDVRSD